MSGRNNNNEKTTYFWIKNDERINIVSHSFLLCYDYVDAVWYHKKKNLFLFHLLFSTCIFIIVYISEQIVK